MRRNWGEMLPLKPPFFKKCKTFESVPLWIMAELTYDFNMNRFKNRLETFKDWPFTEETGSCCTAMKVRKSLQKTNLINYSLITSFVLFSDGWSRLLPQREWFCWCCTLLCLSQRTRRMGAWGQSIVRKLDYNLNIRHAYQAAYMFSCWLSAKGWG